jgi:uncharacterized protein (TIGR03437 family)
MTGRVVALSAFTEATSNTGVFDWLKAGATIEKRTTIGRRAIAAEYSLFRVEATPDSWTRLKTMRHLIVLMMAAQSFAQTGPAWNWAKQVNGPVAATMTGLGTDALGNVYVAGTSGSHIYVTKLDAGGNALFTRSFGGSKYELLNAMAVDSAGNTYLTGITFSSDFPTTRDAWLPAPPPNNPFPLTGGSFLMKVNPDGSLGYSTFFGPILISPNAIAIGPDGSAYLAGSAGPPDSLPVTPGAYRSTCSCGWTPAGFITFANYDTFLARFDATGSKLMFATYLGVTAPNNGYPLNSTGGQSIAVSADGNAYVASNKVLLLDASGSRLLAQTDPNVTAQSIAAGPDGSVYLAGTPNRQKFQATSGALIAQGATASGAIVRLDAALNDVLAATWFGSLYGGTIRTLTTDASGNLYLGGSSVAHGLQTALPLAQGFGKPATGYVAELSGDLGALRFSSYFGDSEYFGVSGIALGPDRSLVLGGATSQPNTSPAPGGNVWVNSISFGAAPAVRIDSIFNAASMLADPIAPGETVFINGAGFGRDAQLLINGESALAVSVETDRVTAVIPQDLTGSSALVQVQTGGSVSNVVLVPTSSTSPGLFSQDGSGLGQGYILNEDGTLNAPEHPAHIGEKITMFATGAGALTFTNGYAVASAIPAVTIDGFYCPGVAAKFGPAVGFPGDVYQLTVYVPDPAALSAGNPNLAGFRFPPQNPLVLRIGSGQSQSFLSISIAQ